MTSTKTLSRTAPSAVSVTTIVSFAVMGVALGSAALLGRRASKRRGG